VRPARATTRWADAHKEEQRGQRAAAQLNRVRSARYKFDLAVEARKVSIHRCCKESESDLVKCAGWMLQECPKPTKSPRDALHNSCEAVVARIGMGYKAFFAANSTAIGKKNNAVDRPSPCCHSPQGVMQSIPCLTKPAPAKNSGTDVKIFPSAQRSNGLPLPAILSCVHTKPLETSRMPARIDIDRLAEQVKTAQDQALAMTPLTSRHPNLDLATAYQIAQRVHQLRLAEGAQPVGLKIGFTNPAMWAAYGVKAPVWGQLYAHTVVHLATNEATCSLVGFVDPKIEPEIVFHFHQTPTPGATREEMLACIDAVALGYEIVQSHYPGWKFAAADATADWAMHAKLLVGPTAKPQDLGANAVEALMEFSVALACDDTVREVGRGSNVLGHPLQAAVHLAAVLAEQPQCRPLTAGDWLTTGTITAAYPVAPGQTWRAELQGIPLPNLSVRFTD
jgi:2-keto-4-pentenoate hydratase